MLVKEIVSPNCTGTAAARHRESRAKVPGLGNAFKINVTTSAGDPGRLLSSQNQTRNMLEKECL